MGHKETDKAKHTLDAVGKAEEEWKRTIERPYDPASAEDREELRRIKRRQSLGKQVLCPICRIKKRNLSAFSIGTGGATLPKNTSENPKQYKRVCRSCESMAKRPKKYPEKHFFNATGHLIPIELHRKRCSLGVSSADFGYHCGWSGARQRTLESGKIRRIAPETRRKIEKAIRVLESDGEK